jgi:hypothetical protein
LALCEVKNALSFSVFGAPEPAKWSAPDFSAACRAMLRDMAQEVTDPSLSLTDSSLSERKWKSARLIWDLQLGYGDRQLGYGNRTPDMAIVNSDMAIANRIRRSDILKWQ